MLFDVSISVLSTADKIINMIDLLIDHLFC